MIIGLVCVFLPGLNREHCDAPHNGYTCEDLESGVSALTKLLSRPRNREIRLTSDVFTDPERLLVRLFTVSLALATDSVPVLVNQSQFGAPSIAKLVPDSAPKELPPTLPFCANITSLKRRHNTWNVSANPAQLLFSPTAARLFDSLGPAALHILVHLTLNLTAAIARVNYDVHFGKFQCPGSAGLDVKGKLNFKAMLSAAAAAKFAHQLPSVAGFLVNLIRGEGPVLFDAVGGACWRAASYIAGGSTRSTRAREGHHSTSPGQTTRAPTSSTEGTSCGGCYDLFSKYAAVRQTGRPCEVWRFLHKRFLWKTARNPSIVHRLYRE
jgi:hypothetical protein